MMHLDYYYVRLELSSAVLKILLSISDAIKEKMKLLAPIVFTPNFADCLIY